MNTKAETPTNKGMLVDPGTHFDGRFELEYKFQVPELERTRDLLDQTQAVAFMLGNTETDYFLDFQDRRLGQNNQFQILREMQPSKRVLWISKGPKHDECYAIELEDFAPSMQMMEALGLEVILKYSKRRDIYFVGACHVTLDHVPELGYFVEVACMYDVDEERDQKAQMIKQVISSLELNNYPETTQSYREMVSAG